MRPLLRAVLALPVALVACAAPAADGTHPAEGPDEPLYTVSAVVLEDPSHGPGLCSIIGLSHPPVCTGVPIANWDWDAVDDERRAARTIWGMYEVVGTYDGTAFTPTRPAVAASESTPTSSPAAFRTPCSEPAGGWTSPDPSRTSDEDRAAALSSAHGRPDFAGAWVHEGVLNIAFTSGLAGHEEEVRRSWGGPLCIVRHERTLDSLERVADELLAKGNELFRVRMLGAEADDVANVVRFDVVLAARDTQARLDARYGEGVVVVHSWLQPV